MVFIDGINVEDGCNILNDSGLDLITAVDLQDTTEKTGRIGTESL